MTTIRSRGLALFLNAWILLVGILAPMPAARADAPPAHVRHYQNLLLDLGYWLPAANGVADRDTAHAVTALQKVAGLPRSGVLDAPTKRAIKKKVRPKARSTSNERIVEVDLQRQVILLVKNKKVLWILDTSTGKPSTPTRHGFNRFYRQSDGMRPSGMYKPKYFWRSAAIHGYASVPNYAASHGCVRVTNATMDWLWKKNALPLGMPIWVY
jgi:peptidoglycan hydrolase-like protein with peptidoglycan-binding domain